MQIRMMGQAPNLIAPPTVRQISYGGLVTDLQFSVAVAPAATLIIIPHAGYSRMITLRNSSPGAQQIRIGYGPSFSAPIRGHLMLPGDSWGCDNYNSLLYAISDLAGALLDTYILESEIP